MLCNENGTARHPQDILSERGPGRSCGLCSIVGGSLRSAHLLFMAMKVADSRKYTNRRNTDFFRLGGDDVSDHVRSVAASIFYK